MLDQQEIKTVSKDLELSSGARLIIASNRGGVEHSIDDFGRLQRHDAGGGVAVALNSIAKTEPLTWIAAASSFPDRMVSIAGGEVELGNGSNLKLINIPEMTYEAHYGSFCNPLLWFIQHSMTEFLQDRDLEKEAVASWHSGYVPTNRLFADAVIDEIDRAGGGRVMLHDYHLYLAPRFIRNARPQATLQHFVHIPWPEPDVWRALPDGLVKEICGGLLANDSIVFQTDEAVNNFLATCRAYLGSRAQVWERRGEIEYLGHTSTAWANPISVDIEELRATAGSAKVQSYLPDLRADKEKLIVRVDRLDPSKNVLGGFQAYERLLEHSPKLHGKVRFLAFMVPSRDAIEEYGDYASATFDLIERINSRFGDEKWQPITVFYEQNRAQALAGLMSYDVLLVNSLADGMNLISKEGPVINQRNGVVVLSETAGSYEQLRPGVIGVDPFDIDGVADGIEQALALDATTRRSKAETVHRAIESHQLQDWLRIQLKDLAIHEYVKGLAQATA